MSSLNIRETPACNIQQEKDKRRKRIPISHHIPQAQSLRLKGPAESCSISVEHQARQTIRFITITGAHEMRSDGEVTYTMPGTTGTYRPQKAAGLFTCCERTIPPSVHSQWTPSLYHSRQSRIFPFPHEAAQKILVVGTGLQHTHAGD